ncbi:MAG: hypothetical protein ACFFAJ_10325 [Candidatus Hodarchaeota archaeon]
MPKEDQVNRKKDINRQLSHLERKYGREPKITRDELLRTRFIWH